MFSILIHLATLVAFVYHNGAVQYNTSAAIQGNIK